ncbi:MAG TPA: dehydrogenase, partial [Eubacteriaceae bacterium]|nr:dehydrogenase [Eubacteriaceae bacterium]
MEADIADDSELEQVEQKVKNLILEVFKRTIDDNISPRMDLFQNPDAIEKYLFSNETKPRMEEGTPDVLTKKEENPRVQRNQKKERVGIVDGKQVPAVKTLQFRDAIFEA